MMDMRESDYSGDFGKLRRTLVNSEGVSLISFARSLKPQYRIVYRDIGFGYVMLVASVLVTAFAPRAGAPAALCAIIGALLIGYWIAYLQLFIHEGAHYNLAASKRTSDLICDWAVSWMVGTSVAQYRIVHFRHHRALGTIDDSEYTYFFPLNLAFILKSLLGVRALEVLRLRRRLQRAQSARNPFSTLSVPLIAGLGVHLAIACSVLLLSGWWVALAWILGLGSVFPFLGAMRQLLEHRDERARSDTDFKLRDHGAFTRLFGDGLLASTFGGAGFNRHLLHHWEPHVSYTNLAELEHFLTDTPARAIMDARRETYLGAIRKLYARV